MWWYCALLLYPCFISSSYGTLGAEDFIKGPSDLNALPQQSDLEENALRTGRQRRSGKQGPGQLTEEDPNDFKYIDLAKKSLDQFTQTSGNSNTYKVVSVEKVTEQVVAGTLTNIDFKVALVDCTPGSNACREVVGYGYRNCHSKVWTRTWLKEETITVDCDIEKQMGNQRQRRQMVGGYTEEDPSNPVYTDLAEKSLAQFIRTSGTSEKYTVTEIKRVTQQMVSGTLVKIDFKVLPTYCTNKRYFPLECNMLFSNKGDCHSEILTEPWLNKETIAVDCDLLKRL